ncbi:MAG: restriction endonuclease subunit S [Lachnospiraceae bacterium]|nr:restriction endonuclease subunit S [Lachnospiraceae bacterium]
MARQIKDSGVEWIGEIPEKWKLRKMKHCTDIIMGQSPDSNDILNTGKTLFMQGNREFGKQYPHPSLYCDNCKKHSRIGDILLSVRAPVGAINESDKIYGIGRGLCSIKADAIENNFLKYYLIKSIDDLKYYSNGSTFEAITIDILQNFYILLPDRIEQQKIVDFLDEKVGGIDSVIAKTKETIEDYRKYKQAIITVAVTKGLNPDAEMKKSKLQWVDSIPKHWKENKILHIVSMPVIDGPHVSPELVDNGVPYISADAIENGKINFDRKRGYITKEYSEECNKRYKPQKDDILVVKLGASTGKMAIVGNETNFNIWVPLAVVRCKVDILPQYVFYSMESSYFKNEIRNGWTFGTQETLGVKTLEQLKVFLPSLEEQKEITEYLDEKCSEIDKLIAKKEELLADLESYKKSLIYEYVTGKKEVE